MYSRTRWSTVALLLAGLLFAGSLIFFLVDSQRNNDGAYDYIVIGSGAGGATMAERLSRERVPGRPAPTVLILEAGPDQNDNPMVQQVSVANSLLTAPYFSEFFWGQMKTFPTTDTSPPAVTGDLLYTAGRCLGGSTSINGMQFVRGTDYMRQRWVDLTGEEIWNVANATQAFRDIETYQGATDVPTSRGNSGPLNVLEQFTSGAQTTPTTMAEKVVQAVSQATGLPPLVDYNTLTPAAQNGPFTSWQMTAASDGTRYNSPRAFLRPDVLARPNLRLLMGATVTRINFDSNNHATSVSYLYQGRVYTVRANRRILLCAGVNSPVILQNSGVGPGGFVYNNPNVGRTLYNHQGLVTVFLKNMSDTPSANPADIYEGGAWLPSALNASMTPPDVSPRMFQLITLNGGPVMIGVIFLLQPVAYGYVHPFDSDPLRMPNVSDNTFLAPDGLTDLDEMVAAVKLYICGMAKEFAGTGSGPAVDPSYIPLSPSAAQCADDAQLRDFVITSTTASAHHWTSSCRMGRVDDGISVANGKGSVHGVTGLTVADGSAIPVAADGNTQAPSYLIGWTLAEEVYWGRF